MLLKNNYHIKQSKCKPQLLITSEKLARKQIKAKQV